MEIRNTPFTIEIYGFSGTAFNKDYAGTAFKLSGKMWQTIKESGIKNKGQNIWVYESDDRVFAGVMLENPQNNNSILEFKKITLEKYAYFKHVGPYNLIKQAGQNMTTEIKRRGFQTELPYLEIYGHWNPDETKQETELIMNLI